jgi:hypothetical protein
MAVRHHVLAMLRLGRHRGDDARERLEFRAVEGRRDECHFGDEKWKKRSA